jgi:hypothetical protein
MNRKSNTIKFLLVEGNGNDKYVIDGKKYRVIKENINDNKNIKKKGYFKTFNRNPYEITLESIDGYSKENILTVALKCNLDFDPLENDLIRMNHWIDLDKNEWGNYISRQGLYDLCAEKTQLFRYFMALNFSNDIDIFNHKPGNVYLGKKIDIPYLCREKYTGEYLEKGILDKYNGRIMISEIGHGEIIDVKMIETKIILNKKNKLTQSLRIMCEEIHDSIGTLIKGYNLKRHFDEKMINYILKQIYKKGHSIDESLINKIKNILLGMMIDKKKKVLEMLEKIYDIKINIKIKEQILRDLVEFMDYEFDTIEEIEDNETDKYISLKIMMPDGDKYTRPSVIEIDPHYCEENIEGIIEKFGKEYFIAEQQLNDKDE